MKTKQKSDFRVLHDLVKQYSFIERYNDKFIKLSKHHIPIHEKRHIRTQEEYDIHLAMLQYLHHQVAVGFDPCYMLTLHYCHPSELLWQKRETKNPLGWKDRISFGSNKPLWDEVGYYNYWHKHRNDLLAVDEDSRHILNHILKTFYGVKRLDKDHGINILMFHEKGKAKLQYHLHILLPQVAESTSKSLTKLFNDEIRPKVKCLSRWKQIKVDAIYDKYNIMGYMNKEVNASHTSISSYSLPIIEAT